MQIRVSDREKETLNEDIWIKIKKKIFVTFGELENRRQQKSPLR